MELQISRRYRQENMELKFGVLVLYLYGFMQLYTCQSTLFEQTMNGQKTVKNMVLVPRVIVKMFFVKFSCRWK